MGGEPGSQNEAEFTPEIPIYLFPIFATVGPLAGCLPLWQWSANGAQKQASPAFLPSPDNRKAIYLLL